MNGYIFAIIAIVLFLIVGFVGMKMAGRSERRGAHPERGKGTTRMEPQREQPNTARTQDEKPNRA